MKKANTVKENREFRYIYRRAKNYTGALLVSYILTKSNNGAVRYGITVSKKTGNAVRRNRAKRVIRAAFDEIKKDICCGCDIIFVARTKTSYAKSTQVAKVMREQFIKAGII